MTWRPLRFTLFPYTTLFRSFADIVGHDDHERVHDVVLAERRADVADLGEGAVRESRERSEEHTSELQSRENLVCRLLLEKKNKRRGSVFPPSDRNDGGFYQL